MSDSFFGFDTELPSLSHDALTLPDDDGSDHEHSDDQLNDETFGLEASEWREESHELAAAQLERERHSHTLSSPANSHQHNDEQKSCDNNTVDCVGDGELGLPDTLYSDLSRLVTDDLDELDDPCVMSVKRRVKRRHDEPPATLASLAAITSGRGAGEFASPVVTSFSAPGCSPAGFPPAPIQRSRSPPVVSVLTADLSGCPSSASIWSEAAAPASVNPPASVNMTRGFPPPPPVPLSGKIRTVEELEQDLLSDAANPSPRSSSNATASCTVQSSLRGHSSSNSSGTPPGLQAPPPPHNSNGQLSLLPDMSRPPPPLPLALLHRPPPPAGGFATAHMRAPVSASALAHSSGGAALPSNRLRHIVPPQLNRAGVCAGYGRTVIGGPVSACAAAEVDFYSGIMTAADCQWLLNIQRLQVASNSDYYFKRYMTRRPQVASNNVAREQGDEKPLEKRDYKPPNVENSLGKLQVASVTAPRRVIDLSVVNSQETVDTKEHGSVQERDWEHRESGRYRTTLMAIEQMYADLLTFTDEDTAGDRQTTSSIEATSIADPDSSSTEAIASVDIRQAALNRLQTTVSVCNSRLLANILTVRKGRSLLLRCAVVLSAQEQQVIVATLCANLASLLGRDRGASHLDHFGALVRKVVNDSNLEQIIAMTSSIVVPAGTRSPVGTRSPAAVSTSPSKSCHEVTNSEDIDTNTLSCVVSSSFGVSVLLMLLMAGQTQQQQNQQQHDVWSRLFAAVVASLERMLPVVAPPMAALMTPPLDATNHQQIINSNLNQIDNNHQDVMARIFTEQTTTDHQ